MRNNIKQFVEKGRWQYNYSSHMNGSVQLEDRDFSLTEQKRQQSLADLIYNIKSGIQTTLNRITFLESEISSLSNTLNKRRHLDGGYNGDSIIMKRKLNTKEQVS